MDATTPSQKEENMNLLPGHYLYSNLPVSIRTPREQIDKALNFAYKPSDIVLATFPRSGTLLTQEIIWQMKNRDTIIPGCNVNIPMLKRFPYIEQDIGGKTSIEILNEEINSPYRLIKTHLPWNLLGRVLKTASVPPCKVVVVIRNPKDVAVSLFNFYKLFTCYSGWPNGNWETFLKEFLNGATMYGDIFDWNIGWWSAEYPSIFFLRYEEILEDPREQIRKLSQFLEEFSITERQVETIVESIQFDTMAANPAINMTLPADSAKIMRKGVAGQWKEMFSPQQNDIFQEVMERRLHGSGLDFN